jgi:hypothetical protein
MKPKTLIASLVAAVSITCWAQPKPVTVATYRGSVVDENLAQEIVREGSHNLFIDNGGTSVSCGLDLAAAVTVLAAPNAVVFPGDDDKVCQEVKANIHVVNRIASCGQYGDANESNIFYGCSKVDCGIVVDINGLPPSTDLKLLAESQWMHEYGHTKALPDRGGRNLLMNPHLSSNQFQLGAPECNQIKGKNPPHETAAAPAPKVDVNTFVRQIYMHGVPLDQARAYTPAEVDQVAGLLASCKASNSDVCSDTPAGRQVEAALPNIVLLIGVAGDAETALKLLVAFLERQPVDSRWFYQARLAVPLAVGYLLRRNQQDELALHFLQDGAHIDIWRTFGMKLAPAESVDTTAVGMTQYSILGLGLSRHPQALLFLQQLEKQLEKQKDPFYQTQSSKDLINHAIKVNQSK